MPTSTVKSETQQFEGAAGASTFLKCFKIFGNCRKYKKMAEHTQERTIDENSPQVEGQTKPAQEGTTNQSDVKVEEEKKEPAATTDQIMTQVEGQTKPAQDGTTNQTNEFSMKKAPLFSTMIDGLKQQFLSSNKKIDSLIYNFQKELLEVKLHSLPDELSEVYHL